MQQRSVARELGLVVAAVAVLVHWLGPSPALVATALVAAVAAVGTGPLVGEWRPWRMPVIPMVLPALAAFSIAGIARLVSPAPWLVLDFVFGWAAVAWVVSLETAPDVFEGSDEEFEDDSYWLGTAPIVQPAVRLRAKPREEFDLAQIVAEPVVEDERDLPPHPRPVSVKFGAIGMAFFGFVAAGGLVPDGLALDGKALGPGQLLMFGILVALVAGLAGYRLAALHSPRRADRIVRFVAFGEYAMPAAAAALILRTIGLPRLFIPALLTLFVYVVAQIRETSDPIAEGRPLYQDMALLGIAAAAILVWGLLVR